MNKLIQKSIFILFLFISAYASAQSTGSVTGKVLNGKDKAPVEYATVQVKKLGADSSIVGGANTTQTGSFTIGNLAPGKYRLVIAFIGFKTINQNFEVTAANPSTNVGSVTLEDTGVNLKSVEIKGEIPPVVVKKDTLEISASTLKVKENAVVEDLLKKVQGVDVAKDGTVTAQGETIKRVRVDGKDFMGSDPLLATRNLPADMVDKIQIIDEMSEQSKFSGVDDGNREKIINIVTKNGVKNKGFVGNNTVGYGTDDRYDVNLNINRFNKNQQISLVGQFNNVNKQNFGGGVGGGGGGRGFQFGGAGGGAQQPGITETNAIGINFGDTYEDGTQLNGSYFFNKTSLFVDRNTLTQTFLGNNTLTNFQDANSTTERSNHRFNFTIDTKLDSSTTIRIQPSISYTRNSASSFEDYNRQAIIGNTVGSQDQLTASTNPAISNSILIRKRFLRRGRTLSLNVNTNINDNDSRLENDNPSTLISPANVITEKLIKNLSTNNSESLNNTARLVFTEPLSKTLSLEVNYQNGYTKDNRQRIVRDFNNTTQTFDIVDLEYSNHFENTTLTNAAGLSLNKNEKKYNWNVGVAVQRTNRENDNLTTGVVFNQNFTNITPTAQFRYTFSNSKRLNIRYDGRTNQPAIEQIQPIRDNTNTQSVPLGNPGLKPSFSNNIRIFYNNFDFVKSRTLFLGAFITQTFNDFGNSQTLITSPADVNVGKIANTYTNVDGNYSINAFGNLGLPIIKGNKLNWQIDLRGNLSQSTNFTEGLKNVTQNYGITNGYKLVSNLDKLDMIAAVYGTWTHGSYTIGESTNFYTLAPSIDISYLFPGNIRLQTDVTYNQITGRGEAFNTNYTLVNAFISRQFFKNKGTFKLSVNDLFNENTGILRTATNNSIVDQNFNVLKRYYMLSFTYSLSSIAGGRGNMQAPGQGGQRMRMGI